MKELHWTSTLDREQLADALSSHEAIRYTDRFPLDRVPEPAPGQVRFGRWSHDTTSDQWDVALVRSGEQRDLLAWITTYFPTMAPMTQWCRVVDKSDLSAFASVAGDRMSSFTAHLWANVVLGECYAQMRDPVGLGSISTHAALSCETFVAARARAVGRIGDADRVAAHWSEVLHMAGQARRVPHEQLESIWYTLDALSAGPDKLSRVGVIGTALAEISTVGALSERGWAELGRGVGVRGAFMPESATQEERLKAYDKLVTRLPDAVDQESAAFLVASAASTVGNGKLDYLDLLTPVLDRYPMAPLWFALHAALVAKNATGAEFAGFGRRVAREIVSPARADDPSRADISSHEVVMLLSNGSAALQTIRGFTKTTLLVEVAPFVSAVLPVTQRDRDQTPSRNQRPLSGSPAPREQSYEGMGGVASESEADRLLASAINTLQDLQAKLRSNKRTGAKQVLREDLPPQADELPLSKTRSRSKNSKVKKGGLFS